jgi:hypothetical protein
MISMKNFYIFIFISSFLTAINGMHSQHKMEYLERSIQVSDKLTTHLIFEEDIAYIDIGSSAFSVDKLKNVAKIKCNNFDNWDINNRTNLTVITKSGAYYSIWVYYAETPKNTTYIYQSKDSYKLDSFDVLYHKKLDEKHCENLINKKANISKKDTNFKMKYQIDGIFYEKDKIVFRLKIENKSKIIFSTDSIRFLLTTKKKFNILKPLKKLNTIQFVEKTAAYVCNNTKDIPANSEHTFLFAFNRFMPTKNEILEVIIVENNAGGRRGKLAINIKNFLISK